jgi:ATP-binding cassette subfamily B multidrug efflux pump
MIKLFRYLKPYRLAVGLTIFFVFLQSMANLYLPTLMADIVDSGIIKGDTDYIVRVGGFMLLVAIGGTVSAVIANYYSARAGVGFGQLVRRALFTQVQRFSLHEFDHIGTASMITRTTNDTTQIQMVLVIALRMMISAPLTAIGGIILAGAQELDLAWILVAVVPILGATIGLILWRATPLFNVLQAKLDALNLILDEGLTGVRVVRAFDRDAHEQRRFDAANQDLTRTAIAVNQITAILMPVLMLILNLASIAIIWFGSIRIDQGQMQVGGMIAFLQYAMQILFSMMMLSMMFIMVPRAMASARRINEVLDLKPEINDAPQVRQAADVRGEVEFRNVTFSYPGAEEPALTDISFRSGPGEVTAIIGGTGAGKSTLINLIPRFYDVDSGSVLVDGVDIRELAQEELRAKIGYVPQRAVLFSGTAMSNIRYGDAGAPDDTVRRAAEVAQAEDFITAMPEGFASRIAQGGTNLSGGQKQRLSIARALARQAEIYLFDDSFSALDFKTDARLRAALQQETRTSTVLIVAQRVSTVMNADRIIALDNGRVAGIGTHRELMETCEVYREIVVSQLATEAIA